MVFVDTGVQIRLIHELQRWKVHKGPFTSAYRDSGPETKMKILKVMVCISGQFPTSASAISIGLWVC